MVRHQFLLIIATTVFVGFLLEYCIAKQNGHSDISDTDQGFDIIGWFWLFLFSVWLLHFSLAMISIVQKFNFAYFSFYLEMKSFHQCLGAKAQKASYYIYLSYRPWWRQRWCSEDEPDKKIETPNSKTKKRPG